LDEISGLKGQSPDIFLILLVPMGNEFMSIRAILWPPGPQGGRPAPLGFAGTFQLFVRLFV
jgi:hypothetical protein